MINSGTCFRAPDEVLERWRDEAGSTGSPSSDPSTRRPRRCCTSARWTRSGWAGTASSCSRAPRRWASRTTRSRATRAAASSCSSCPYGCRLDAKRAMHVSYLPRAVAAGARVRAGVEARRLRFEGDRAIGRRLRGRRRAAAAARPPRPFQVGRPARRDRRRRRVRHTGAAAALRRALASGELGRNLRIHPACWVGRALRGGGPRLGRRHAELRGGRVAGAGPAAGGDVHAARVRRPLDAGHRRRAPGAPGLLRPRRVDRRPPVRPLEGTRRRSPATARCGSPTG